MRKTHADAVEWLIETVKEALENGTATEDDLQEWLLAAVLLEEMAVEEEAEAHTLAAWIEPSPTIH